MTNDAERYLKERDRLFKVLDVNAVISASLNLEVVLDTLMEKAKDVLDAEASSLMLLNDDDQTLRFHTVKGDKSDAVKKIELKLGEGIAGWVAQEGKPLLVEDAANDPRFFKRADQTSQFQTRTMVCAPLRSRRQILGTVQVLNKRGGDFFNQDDLRILEIMAHQAAIAIVNARLHTMATVDQATGLYMKHYFLANLEEEFRRAKTKSGNVSLIMSDIDFFKKVNDNFGHQGGDVALVELARVIQETVGELKHDDMAGRYGGEEFCVLLPDSDETRALQVAELIRKNIESRPITIGDKTANITISVGVASFPFHKDHIEKSEDFIRLADEALYICKKRGRNCAALYEKVE